MQSPKALFILYLSVHLVVLYRTFTLCIVVTFLYRDTTGCSKDISGENLTDMILINVVYSLSINGLLTQKNEIS
jgi:hypothetical protein